MNITPLSPAFGAHDSEALLDELWRHASLPQNVGPRTGTWATSSSGTTAACCTAVTPSRTTCGEWWDAARYWLV